MNRKQKSPKPSAWIAHHAMSEPTVAFTKDTRTTRHTALYSIEYVRTLRQQIKALKLKLKDE